MAKHILFIGGYARAGKTRAVTHLRESGLSVYSTSAKLDNLLEKVLTIYQPDTSIKTHEHRRALKIQLAEDILVPIFSRNVFAVAIAADIQKDDSPIVVIETIGGEEHRCLVNMLRLLVPDAVCRSVNIRSKEEMPGVDIRQLLPDAIEVNNHNWTVDGGLSFLCEIDQVVASIPIGDSNG